LQMLCGSNDAHPRGGFDMSLNVGQAEKHSRHAAAVEANTLRQVLVPAHSPDGRARRAAAIAAASDFAATPELVVVPRRRRNTPIYDFSKRLFDLIAGSMLLLLAAPVILAAATWIRLESRGSPFFFQTRLGRDGKSFKIFKLRGMYIDARQRHPELYDYSHNPNLDFHFHYSTDPRVTKAGRFLRRTSVDELPNLWNVVAGDMSLVGPRPEIPELLAMYGPYREEYLSVKPGITCRSKITGRDVLTKRESIEFDLLYVRDRGFAADLAVLWKTFLSVISRRDVY
jgi:lipopolysaccharide/colanic/teichoic acid biosynthesis glycosyltransferase